VSDSGFGGVILTKADVPFNLAENLAVRTISTIGLTWDEGLETGGAPVLDYKVSVSTGGDYYVYITTL
jgi:hypothetical protein